VRRTVPRRAIGALLAWLAVSACSRRAPPPGETTAPIAAAPARSAAPARVTVRVENRAMCTPLLVLARTTATVDDGSARRAIRRAIDEIRRLEGLFTTWRDDSEIARLNAAAGVAPVPVSPETLDVLEASLAASALSGGAFDVTVEAFHGLWRFDEDLDPRPPAPSAIAARLALVGSRHLHVDRAAGTASLDLAGARVGLGGIGKGYAVDRAAGVLRAAKLADFVVQLGGDLYAAGEEEDGRPWSVGVRDPRGGPDDSFATLGVRDHAFSTAGDYERAFVAGSKRYHHILDPRTGEPARLCRSVTIHARTALEADALDDAVFVLGPERGLALVESIEGVGAVIVDAAGRVHVSRRLEGALERTATPRPDDAPPATSATRR
jgi:thiamine biosynthesis lipoprotein